MSVSYHLQCRLSEQRQENTVIGNPLAKATIATGVLSLSTLFYSQTLYMKKTRHSAIVLLKLRYNRILINHRDHSQASARQTFPYTISHFAIPDSNTLRSAFSTGLASLEHRYRTLSDHASCMYDRSSLLCQMWLHMSSTTFSKYLLAIRRSGSAGEETPQEGKRKKTVLWASAALPCAVRLLLTLLGGSHEKWDSKCAACKAALLATAWQNLLPRWSASLRSPSRSTAVRLCIAHTLRAFSFTLSSPLFASGYGPHPSSPSAHTLPSGVTGNFTHGPPAVTHSTLELWKRPGRDNAVTVWCCLTYIDRLIQVIRPLDADPKLGIDYWEEREPESMGFLIADRARHTT
ncbi:hypothetical protein D9613_012542 [Agrocybe pediades]|uniref:Uncharacterized protein n=1 Tax=Agrocybe pediades TaxID=84607 RepID=A0A8H4VN21_9AGAR|nr:hypothetical protein D9613_012542 [Agrocybe pediades]